MIRVASGHANWRRFSIGLVLVGVLVGAPAAQAGPAGAAKSYISHHESDARRLQANVQVVQLAIGAFVKSSTRTNLAAVGQLAQQAQATLVTIHDNFVGTDNGALGGAELLAFAGAHDLSAAMAALVAYTGKPNRTTLTRFTTRYQRARGEWDEGVRAIWKMAGRKDAPVV